MRKDQRFIAVKIIDNVLIGRHCQILHSGNTVIPITAHKDLYRRCNLADTADAFL